MINKVYDTNFSFFIFFTEVGENIISLGLHVPIISKVYNFVEMYIKYTYKSTLIGIAKL